MQKIFSAAETLIKVLGYVDYGPQAIVDLLLMMMPNKDGVGKCQMFPNGLADSGCAAIAKIDECDVHELLQEMRSTV
eukprot:6828587-Pyramimonas_sp.AAC.1